MAVEAIIFDFDGVIHDTFELAYSINRSISKVKITKEEYKDFFNGNIYDRKEISEEHSTNFFREQNKAFEYLRIEKRVKLFLEDFSKNYPLFVISSNQECALNLYLNNNNLNNIFTEVLGQETHRSKVEKFNLIFRKHNLISDKCVFVTDTLGDILEANKVNVKTIAVDFGFHQRDRLEKGNPFKIVSILEEIPKIVNELNN